MFIDFISDEISKVNVSEGPGQLVLFPGMSVNLPRGACITSMVPFVKYRLADSEALYDVSAGIRVSYDFPDADKTIGIKPSSVLDEDEPGVIWVRFGPQALQQNQG